MIFLKTHLDNLPFFITKDGPKVIYRSPTESPIFGKLIFSNNSNKKMSIFKKNKKENSSIFKKWRTTPKIDNRITKWLDLEKTRKPTI